VGPKAAMLKKACIGVRRKGEEETRIVAERMYFDTINRIGLKLPYSHESSVHGLWQNFVGHIQAQNWNKKRGWVIAMRHSGHSASSGTQARSWETIHLHDIIMSPTIAV
jgi:hypothetical protein